MTGYIGYGFDTNQATNIPNLLKTRFQNTAAIPAQYNPYFSLGFATGLSFYIQGNGGTPKPLPAPPPPVPLPTGQTIDQFVAAWANAYNLPFSTSVIKQYIENYITYHSGLSSFDQTTMAAVSNAKANPSDQDPILFGDNVLTDAADLTFNQWQKSGLNVTLEDYLIQLAGVSLSTQAASPASGTALNLEEVYNAFFQTNVPAFQSYLASYIKELMYPTSGTGTAFLPSNQIGPWLQKVQEAYTLALRGTASTTSSSLGGSYQKTAILQRLFALIVDMIGTLQQVAASQSDRLRLLTQWQASYTNLMGQVHTFTPGDGSGIYKNANGDTAETKAKVGEQANVYNSTITETLRSRRTIVQDEAKTVQSNLNQSNDSANQQANTATAIIQTLSTLLGAIYR